MRLRMKLEARPENTKNTQGLCGDCQLVRVGVDLNRLHPQTLSAPACRSFTAFDTHYYLAGESIVQAFDTHFLAGAQYRSTLTTILRVLISACTTILRVLISCCQPPQHRPNEVNGIHYNFTTQEAMLPMIEADEFLESANVRPP